MLSNMKIELIISYGRIGVTFVCFLQNRISFLVIGVRFDLLPACKEKQNSNRIISSKSEIRAEKEAIDVLKVKLQIPD